ncbi:MAG: CRTAC1 family protein [Chthoniobacterales bacterium]|nr:CRTAC1 family protein [Chthoniobacterales bacterium]
MKVTKITLTFAKTSLFLLATIPLLLEARTTAQPSGAVPLPVFTDVTASAGLNLLGYPFGDPIWGDFDNDGDLDLFVDNHYNKAPYFYRNNGDGTFTDIFLSTTVRFSGDRHGSAWIDLAHTGLLDLHITIGANKGGALGMKEDEFLLNNGDGTFSEDGEAAGITNTYGRGRSIAWADYDNDGYPDLLLGNLQTQMVFYKNNGDGTFTDVSAGAGLTGYQYVEVAWADYNNDGYPDVFCTDALFPFQPSLDKLLKNNGDGTFTDVTAQAGIQALTFGRSIAWGDYNNDGYLDLFISRGSTTGLKQTLYKNNGDGTFTDVSDAAKLGVISNNRAAAWGDFDNDGYLDLYVVTSGNDTDGKGPSYLYHNNRNGTFTDVAATVGAQAVALSRGRGAAWADYDSNGFLDLFVTNGEDGTAYSQGPQILYHNGGNVNNWLEVKLVGTTSNRQGLGARVTITIGRAIQYREMNGSMGHFLSQGSTPLHFGTGKATIINTVVVKWPSGVVQTLTKVAADQQLTVVEGQ